MTAIHGTFAGIAHDAERFVQAALARLGSATLEDVPFVTDLPPVRFEPIKISNPYKLTPNEITQLKNGFYSRFGAVAFDCGLDIDWTGQHPLVFLGDQLRDVVPCRWRISNSRFADGTGKVYDSGSATVTPASNRALAAHQDAVFMPSVVSVVGMFCDSPPAIAGLTYTQNLLQLGLDLYRREPEAFESLFAPDALTVYKHTKGKSRRGPVFFTDDRGPQVFFHAPGEEYEIEAGQSSACQRAIEFLVSYTEAEANGSASIEFDRIGQGLFVDNVLAIHGRGSYVDGSSPQQKRVIAIGWWADSAPDLSVELPAMT